jgi:hypothetical protein
MGQQAGDMARKRQIPISHFHKTTKNQRSFNASSSFSAGCGMAVINNRKSSIINPLHVWGLPR